MTARATVAGRGATGLRQAAWRAAADPRAAGGARGRWVAVALALCLAVAAGGCGKRGTPVAPGSAVKAAPAAQAPGPGAQAPRPAPGARGETGLIPPGAN